VIICSCCHTSKDEYEFHKRKASRTGLQSKCKTCTAAYSDANKDRIKKYGAEYYKENKDKRSKQGREYYQAHREQVIKRTTEYNKTSSKKAAWRRMYESQRRRHDPLFKLIQNTRVLVRDSINGRGYVKSSKTAKLLGCSFEDYMIHLGPKPCEDAEIDHICPVAQAQTEDEVIRLQHYTNLQWLPKRLNVLKSDNRTVKGVILCNSLLGRDWVDRGGT
jgi:hypothetical protein